MDLSKTILSDIRGSPCPICNRERMYKSVQGAKVGRDKPCRSCTNSISQGGKGWSELCIDCGVNLRDPKYNSQCKSCHNKRSKEYYKKTYRWSKYGLDGPIDMEECELCKSTDDLVIDHCHTHNHVRGVLCRTCNVALGLLKDDADLLQRASEYLRKSNGSK